MTFKLQNKYLAGFVNWFGILGDLTAKQVRMRGRFIVDSQMLGEDEYLVWVGSPHKSIDGIDLIHVIIIDDIIHGIEEFLLDQSQDHIL